MGVPRGYALLEDTKGHSEYTLNCNLCTVTPVGPIGQITTKEPEYELYMGNYVTIEYKLQTQIIEKDFRADLPLSDETGSVHYC